MGTRYTLCGRVLPNTFHLNYPSVGGPGCPAYNYDLLWNVTETRWIYAVGVGYGPNGIKLKFLLDNANSDGNNSCDFTLYVKDDTTGYTIDAVTLTHVNCCPTMSMQFACTALNRYVGCSATNGPTLTVTE